MSITATAGTLLGAGQGLIGLGQDIFGGGKEDGYGLAKEGTLEWYIDKLKGVSDRQAIDMAQVVLQNRYNGASDMEIREYLKRNSGEKVLGREEYQPILNKADEIIRQAKAKQSSPTVQQPEPTGQTSQPQQQAGGVNIAGMQGKTMLLLASAIGGFLIFNK